MLRSEEGRDCVDADESNDVIMVVGDAVDDEGVVCGVGICALKVGGDEFRV